MEMNDRERWDCCVRPGARDYRWLLDRGYPDQPTIKLVGDRYRLTRVERGMLYRGIFSESASLQRSRRLREPGTVAGSSITIDGYNVLFTVWNYLAGRPLVAATDGFVRDIGGTRSRLPRDERFVRVCRSLVRSLLELQTGDVTVFLDEQLPWSRDHGVILQDLWDEATGGDEEGRAPCRVLTETSVDARVAATVDGIIVTSDTGIIDRCTVAVLDLAGHVLRHDLGAMPANLL
ncbi:MAG: DUF434 domain-containing protein [Spirochaetaceae bacterium]|nr:MAG: DUF434 domain-containing protein [Spirochaetaceae bacterium]